jgi:hypothetical protein
MTVSVIAAAFGVVDAIAKPSPRFAVLNESAQRMIVRHPLVGEQRNDDGSVQRGLGAQAALVLLFVHNGRRPVGDTVGRRPDAFLLQQWLSVVALADANAE